MRLGGCTPLAKREDIGNRKRQFLGLAMATLPRRGAKYLNQVEHRARSAVCIATAANGRKYRDRLTGYKPGAHIFHEHIGLGAAPRIFPVFGSIPFSGDCIQPGADFRLAGITEFQRRIIQISNLQDVRQAWIGFVNFSTACVGLSAYDPIRDNRFRVKCLCPLP